VQQSLPHIVSVDGKPISERQLRGKIVLINFWASWCAACRKELPSLERLSANRPDLQVIAASVDSNRRDAINAFGRHYGHLQLSFASLDDVQQFGALGMPYSVILDRDGHEAARVPRALDWQGPEARRLLKRAQ
jgi:thiol-disulfide isomerase/thioredoxin